MLILIFINIRSYLAGLLCRCYVTVLLPIFLPVLPSVATVLPLPLSFPNPSLCFLHVVYCLHTAYAVIINAIANFHPPPALAVVFALVVILVAIIMVVFIVTFSPLIPRSFVVVVVGIIAAIIVVVMVVPIATPPSPLLPPLIKN